MSAIGEGVGGWKIARLHGSEISTTKGASIVCASTVACSVRGYTPWSASKAPLTYTVPSVAATPICDTKVGGVVTKANVTGLRQFGVRTTSNGMVTGYTVTPVSMNMSTGEVE